ncbi:MAG: NAD(+)/NADH kinase [Desulfobacterales bacterium]|nr:MAG: NAD(+)/NADH kinase [Desulfobacterales bacterium]
MSAVGIIANPASGKDIRRLVAYGSVFDNNEKVNIVRRVVLGLDAMGVREVVFMPDYFGIGVRAMEDLEVSLKASFLAMKREGTAEDSVRAAEILNRMGVACIVTLGGDGTNRVVAKTCADTPLLPISTGTNNVFPFMVEGTLAGMAAGVAALNRSSRTEFISQAPRLEIRRNGQMVDIALIDVVVSKPGFVASRALWDVSELQEIFLSRAEPEHIGFSSVGGLITGLAKGNGQGVYIRIGPGPHQVKAPIAPGLIRWVPVKSYRVFKPGEPIPLAHLPAMIALDGERERIEGKQNQVTVELNPCGPWVVDIPRALRKASDQGLFLNNNHKEVG